MDLLTADVLQARSISLARPDDGVGEPPPLRRRDGTSAYRVAGADLYTSARILRAEQRLVAAAGRVDGHTVEQGMADRALADAAATGMELNPGQASLVRAMATSGARVQLAIAPAGTGKTTAMRALTVAWTAGGGRVIGPAPSAAAAAQLGEQTGAPADTLAKLTFSLASGDRAVWDSRIGATTLVIIDEAGMADTLSLDAAVAYVLGRGGSVRLVGDDQQLAAVGAGGVLRDIDAHHGAVRLTELLRFADPAEAAATLALRDGRPEALGFYLDQHRVHVGNSATIGDAVFAAWQADRDAGLDAIMLAPTRDLAAQLNQRARTHRLTGTAVQGRSVGLADGNQAGVGDLVITRANDRRLRTAATDWVKNGDRWTVRGVTDHGDLDVQHNRTGRTVRLPAGYVTGAVDLGYATTVHTAQGVTADTAHSLVAGAETRQQLYTALTRGRTSNHVYLQVAGDGDPHDIIRPSTVHPATPTELLEAILARDGAAESATTRSRRQRDPAQPLGEATDRYLDALHLAAEDIAGPAVVDALDSAAERLAGGLLDQPAWPTLRAHLLLLAAGGADPVPRLAAAAGVRELDTAADKAAVVDWRLDDTELRAAGPGPLPWLPAIPDRLRHHRRWGAYLHDRAGLVADLADQVRAGTDPAERPGWLPLSGVLPRELVLTSRCDGPPRPSNPGTGGPPVPRSCNPRPAGGSSTSTGSSATPPPGVAGVAAPGRRSRKGRACRPVHSRSGRTSGRPVSGRSRRPPTPR